ncbi:MAG: VCBS repeat-containing protein [Kofleriaceae bacterium]
MRRVKWGLHPWLLTGLVAVSGSARADDGDRGDHDGRCHRHDEHRRDGERGEHARFTFEEAPGRLPGGYELAGTSTTDVDLVDVDGDGDLDIFLAQGTDSLAGRANVLLINDGCGGFTDESAARLPHTGDANSTKVDFGDIDDDGDLDAIIANVGPEQLLINDGDGFFSDGSSRLPPPVNIFENISANAAFADLDGDGALDIVVSNENPFNPSPLGGAQNRIFLNDGTGAFEDQTAARLPPALDQTGAMVPGDVDGDGDLDLLIADRGQDRVLINDGLGVFTEETGARFPVTGDSTRGAAVADLDGDCDLDVLAANSRNQPMALYFNDGAGGFSAGLWDVAPLQPETDSGVELVDLDRDGDLDAYVVNAGGFEAGHGFTGGPDRYFRNDGHGRFVDATSAHFAPPSAPTTDAAFGDLDGDGDEDLVTGQTGDNGDERVFLQRSRADRRLPRQCRR